MARKSRRVNVAERVTNQIIKTLERGDLPPWKSPKFTGSILPINATSKRQYRGVNIWTLASEAIIMEYEDNRWLTFQQAKKAGGYIRKGEKSTPVVFWKILEFEDQDSYEVDATKKVPLSNLYHVFNVSQTEGCELPEYIPAGSIDHDPIISAENIISNMPKMPKIEDMQTIPSYHFGRDVIMMPGREVWKDIEEYYHTLFHEMAHSTGHSRRMDRIPNLQALGNKNSEDYAREELIAEMSAAVLCGHSGICLSNVENSAAYISTWLENIKKHPDILMISSQMAQRVSDYILCKDNHDESNTD